MTSLEYAADAARLALAVRPTEPTFSPYISPPDDRGIYVIELDIRASRLSEYIAVQQALQLALDAAQVAVFYEGSLEEVEGVAAYLDDPDVTLTLIWAGNGSMKLALAFNAKSERGRWTIRLLFTIGLGVLYIIPGGALFALAYEIALEVILEGFRRAEEYERPAPMPVQSIDSAALEAALVRMGITPPDKSWVAPSDRTDEGERKR